MASGADATQEDATPPRTADGPRKRLNSKATASTEGDDAKAKKPRSDVPDPPAFAAAVAASPPAVVASGASTRRGPAGDRPTFDAAAGEVDERETDLRSTLQAAQRARPGAIPPFTAECLCHFASGGAQYSWPSWLMPENLKDADGRTPSDPAYNQGTLWVPDGQTQKQTPTHGTPMLLQYWKLKANHFDKIAFFKVGKFYELFYYDAFIAQRVCDLKWMGEKKPHVGFPEMAKHTYARKIVDAGYKVVVVEQVERVVEQQQRKADEKNAGPTCVERDACEVYTNGTLVDPELLGSAGAKYMLCLHFHKGSAASPDADRFKFSASLVDCATSQIQVGTLQDGLDRNALRTLLAQCQPAEVVYSVANIPADVLGMIKRLPCRPQLSPLLELRGSDAMAARSTLSKYRLAHPDKFPEALQTILAQDGATIAAAGVIKYLEMALLAKRVLPIAIWDVLAPTFNPLQDGVARTSGISRRLVLDATALSALEVLETLEGTYKGSLLEYLNHTGTEFGFRLLKQWLCSPLYETEDIRERQQAVEFFVGHADVASQLRTGLKKVLVDLERATSRIWSFALQSERNAVYYEDVTAKRLGMFRELLLGYEHCLGLLRTPALQGQGNLPKRLAQITRVQERGGCLPDLQGVITRLLGSVVQDTSTANGKVKFRPSQGAYKPYDDLSLQIEGHKAYLEQELVRVRAQFPKVQFAFVHRLPGYRFEIECDLAALPQAYLKTVQETFRNKAKLRFQTPLIAKLVAEMDALEDKREDCIFPFLSQIFQQFHSHQAQFRAAVRCIAEIDALLSLAVASQGLAGSSCLAEIVTLADENQPGTLELRNCRHPVAAAKMGTAFVPNDTFLNVRDVPGVLVVTGPNMGGKSTVLRQTCIAVIMAQIGCRVNADACRLSPVDRIFTRIGSYDTILEGKSTLLTELEETSSILAYGSGRSLAVLDELGRGTSTFDGAAIASAVLDELTNRVRCLVLFATHYHPVSREASKSPFVRPFHMSADVDPRTNEMTFLYRFLPGLCPASHGHNVARLAGLPPWVLEVALAKSAEFEAGGFGRSAGGVAAEVARLAEAGDIAGLQALYERQRRAATP